MWVPWNLVRNPLVPSVPLEGSDTVQGLRTLERLRAAELLSGDGNVGTAVERRKKSRRSRYQRYKGPFIEYLGADEFTRDGKPWKEFGGGGQGVGRRGMSRSFDVSASLDLLAERIDENLVYYASNYVRISLVVLLLMTYLRPKSIVGIVVMAYNIYSNYDVLVQRGGEDHRRQQDSNRTIVMAMITWVAMIYSKCMPIISLALLVSMGVIMVHASLRRAPSEDRYKGRKPISYSFESVIRGLPRDSRRVCREIVSETGQAILHLGITGKRWLKYYGLLLFDSIQGIFRR